MWKDVTSYRKSDTERKPTTFQWGNKDLSITITCNHVDYKPEWVMHCRALDMDTLPLPKGFTFEQACASALATVRLRLAKLTQLVGSHGRAGF